MENTNYLKSDEQKIIVSFSLVTVIHALKVYSPTLTYARMHTLTKVAAGKHLKDISCEIHELHYIKFNWWGFSGWASRGSSFLISFSPLQGLADYNIEFSAPPLLWLGQVIQVGVLKRCHGVEKGVCTAVLTLLIYLVRSGSHILTGWERSLQTHLHTILVIRVMS